MIPRTSRREFLNLTVKGSALGAAAALVPAATLAASTKNKTTDSPLKAANSANQGQYITVGKENGANIELYYEDHGSGRPVVLIHGYPLSGAAWEKQVPALLNAGYRVITYDRRGFGKSSQPTDGYNTDLFLGKRVSEEVVRASWNIAAGASATASVACVPTWIEDFRPDVARIDVPTLIIHGDEDRVVPLAASGQRTAKLIKGARLLVIKGGPHCITWTHADEVNAGLLDFMQS